MSDEQEEPTTGSDADMGSTSGGDQQDTPETEESAEQGDSSESEDLKTELDKWKAWARKHEENSRGADQAREERDQLREQVKELDELREQTSAQETAATEARHALASERLHTKLARAGVSEDDATALTEHIDPARLTEDGQPSAKAIDAVAASLSRSASRGVDEDQGQTSEAPSFSPDQWLRKKARR